MNTRFDITGLVLAGGRGSRMGGVDKGLQMLEGEALVRHALRRLTPQVDKMIINANRNLDEYAQLGAPVWPDVDADYAGPLAGFLVGLSHCDTDWLVTVPCDTPRFPLNFVARLANAVGDASAAVVVTEEVGTMRRQPVFCLMRRSLKADLEAYVAGGGRKIERWLELQGCVDVIFDEADAFVNANSVEELRRIGPSSSQYSRPTR